MEVKEQLRVLLRTISLADAAAAKEDLKVLVEAAARPETNKLYRTVSRWCKEIEVLIVTGAITGKVEANNTGIKHIKRCEDRVGKSGPLHAHRITAAALPLEEQQLRRPRLNEGVRAGLRILICARESMTTDCTRAVNALTALLRVNDLGLDALRLAKRLSDLDPDIKTNSAGSPNWWKSAKPRDYCSKPASVPLRPPSALPLPPGQGTIRGRLRLPGRGQSDPGIFRQHHPAQTQPQRRQNPEQSTARDRPQLDDI